jgi:hypothetical protein
VAVADVNGDGRPDIVATGASSASYAGKVSVLLGNGNGTFHAAKNFSASIYDNSVAVADVNRDGLPDVIVADGTFGFGGSVSVLLGNGDGTFQTAQSFAVGVLPRSVGVADVNGDGKPDLVVANESSGTVSVLSGNGDGTFAAARNFTTGLYPVAVVVADVNGDGHPDLVTANHAGARASVLLGNGNGTFAAAQNFATGSQPSSVAVADLNGDGLPDLAVANGGGASVSVLLGQRNAATHLRVSAPGSATAGASFTITVSALTADGDVDDLYGGTVTFSSSDSQAVLPANYTFTRRDLGVHSFSITLNSTGTQTVTATDKFHPSITDTATVTVNSAKAGPRATGDRLTPTATAAGTATSGAAGAVTVASLETWTALLAASPVPNGDTVQLPIILPTAAPGRATSPLEAPLPSALGRPVALDAPMRGYTRQDGLVGADLRRAVVEALFAADGL